MSVPLRYKAPLRTGLKSKRKIEAHVPQTKAERIIKPPTRPFNGLVTVGPDGPQVVFDSRGEFDSDVNIFDIQTQNDKQKPADIKEYRLTPWKEEGFTIVEEEE